MLEESSSPAHATRPTLRVIAQAAGTSLAATSMALRNHAGISAKTRAHVQAVALKLGYHPDPKLSMLMQHLRTQCGVEYYETIGYLSFYPDSRWKKYSQYYIYEGAAERAVELGYRVEIFQLEEPGMTPERMNNVLKARGIRGLLIGGTDQPNMHLDLDWDHFAAVSLSYTLASPALHCVSTDFYREMLSTLNRLQQEGYKRIGLNVNLLDDIKTFNLWRSAYLLYQDKIPKKQRLSINATPWGRGNLEEWVHTQKPDVIISAACDFPEEYEKAYSKAPPTHIHYVNMNIFQADARSRGVDQNGNAVGRLACGSLISMLQRFEIGLPEHPQITSIDGKWVENYTEWAKRNKKSRAAL